jgi:hypothetical protein
VTQGTIQQFSAVVNGTGSPAQTVTWTVTGGTGGSTISTTGDLTVPVAEPVDTILTVWATSTVDATKSGTATVTITELVLNTIANIETYLAAASGGDSAADPILLPVTVNLDSAQWTGILSAIAGKGKYVTLDLTDCAGGTHSSGGGLYNDGTFDPGTENGGEEYVTALILPDAATKVEEGVFGASTFRYFTALESVSGDNVTNISQYAFYNFAGLISADFPAATNIGKEAFTNCQALTSVNLPLAETIQESAFLYCYGLISVYLPAVTSIGDYAFISSTALTTVTINSSCNIIDPDSFPNGFKNYYDTNGKLYGVYTWNGTAWSYAP